jgi:hypothetical protein
MEILWFMIAMVQQDGVHVLKDIQVQDLSFRAMGIWSFMVHAMVFFGLVTL